MVDLRQSVDLHIGHDEVDRLVVRKSMQNLWKTNYVAVDINMQRKAIVRILCLQEEKQWRWMPAHELQIKLFVSVVFH